MAYIIYVCVYIYMHADFKVVEDEPGCHIMPIYMYVYVYICICVHIFMHADFKVLKDEPGCHVMLIYTYTYTFLKNSLIGRFVCWI